MQWQWISRGSGGRVRMHARLTHRPAMSPAWIRRSAIGLGVLVLAIDGALTLFK